MPTSLGANSVNLEKDGSERWPLEAPADVAIENYQQVVALITVLTMLDSIFKLQRQS